MSLHLYGLFCIKQNLTIMNHTRRILTIISGIIAAVLICINTVNAQKFEGMATYQSDQDMSTFSFQGDNVSPETKNELKAQLKKQFQKEYVLKFNLTESIWAEAEGLDAGAVKASTGGMSLTISTGGGILYKNSEAKNYVEQTETFSKQFLIKDKLEERKWVLTGKQKNIGEYEAQEATYQRIREQRSFTMSNEDEKSETVMDTTMITAWFAPGIPVPHGPDSHWGLPGLILEITDGRMTYLCTKVVLHPSEKLQIKAPTKGKEVNEKEFEIINEELAESMMKKYSGGDDEHVMSIKISN